MTAVTQEQALRLHHNVAEDAKTEQFKMMGRADLPPAALVRINGQWYGGATEDPFLAAAVDAGAMDMQQLVHASIKALWVKHGRSGLDAIVYIEEAYGYEGNDPPDDLDKDFRTNAWSSVTEDVISIWVQPTGVFHVTSAIRYGDGGTISFGKPKVHDDSTKAFENTDGVFAGLRRLFDEVGVK
jgi:hypothetical protein